MSSHRSRSFSLTRPSATEKSPLSGRSPGLDRRRSPLHPVQLEAPLDHEISRPCQPLPPIPFSDHPSTSATHSLPPIHRWRIRHLQYLPQINFLQALWEHQIRELDRLGVSENPVTFRTELDGDDSLPSSPITPGHSNGPPVPETSITILRTPTERSTGPRSSSSGTSQDAHRSSLDPILRLPSAAFERRNFMSNLTLREMNRRLKTQNDYNTALEAFERHNALPGFTITEIAQWAMAQYHSDRAMIAKVYIDKEESGVAKDSKQQEGEDEWIAMDRKGSDDSGDAGDDEKETSSCSGRSCV